MGELSKFPIIAASLDFSNYPPDAHICVLNGLSSLQAPGGLKTSFGQGDAVKPLRNEIYGDFWVSHVLDVVRG